MRFSQAAILAGMMLAVAAGCDALNPLPGRTFHQRCGWKAEDYFTNPQVIALCHAIEANDLADMDRLLQNDAAAVGVPR